ncbi:MAG TPA: TldD/PmbA family protein [Acidobacteriota bacterium]|nr:TldD/PmbA family protein [Acidobacteriota bacterium]
MKKELYDLAEEAIAMATAGGASACRIRIDSERTVQIGYRERKPETLREASTKTLSLEIFVDGRYSRMSTSDLRKEALREFVGRAVAQTRLLAGDPDRSLPDPGYYRGRHEHDLELSDPGYADWDAASRHAFVAAIENACLAEGGDKAISVTAGTRDGYRESILMASNGFDGYSEDTYFLGSAQMTAADEGGRRPADYAGAVAIHREDLVAPEKIGKEAARRTLALLGGRKIKTGTLPVIIENRVAGRILSGLLDAMSGRAVQQKRSFLSDRKGAAIASDILTLVDDPLIRRGLGSTVFDADGLASRKRVMIGAGVLNEFYVDWYYSRKLDREPTTGSPTNLIIPPGRRSPADIMKDIGRGILITGFIGGSSNSTTGDFSVGIIGQLFEEGVLVHAVSEMNIADNHLRFWRRLREVANDPYPYSNEMLPSLVFGEVVVSGL